jgi:signal transduction histidine kinase
MSAQVVAAVAALAGAGLLALGALGVWLASLAGTVVLVVGTWLAAMRWHAARLDAATAALERVTAGDFEVRVALSGTPALGALARAVNRVGHACARRDDDLNDALEDAARQRDLFYSIINASSDGLLLYDASRRLVAANPRCGELLGFTLDELLHRDPAWLQISLQSRCEQPDRYHERLDAHFGHPEQTHQDLLVVFAPRRRVIRRFSSPVVVHRRDGGRVFTYTDVTAEADIDRMKSEFVSMASHELRTPLTSVHGALQLALTGSGHLIGDEDRELLEISLTSTERLVRLVNDLLDLSKIEAGRMPVSRAAVDVDRLIEDAIRSMQGFAANRRARIVASVAPDLPRVMADRDQALRVLTNLLSNALEYSPRESAVVVDARAVGDGVAMSVTDDGPGIPAAHLERLFRPFSRVGVHERQTAGGTGLGLAITRAIVEQHGGRIWVEPVEPAGSRFVVVLPTLPTDTAAIDTPPEADVA